MNHHLIPKIFFTEAGKKSESSSKKEASSKPIIDPLLCGAHVSKKRKKISGDSDSEISGYGIENLSKSKKSTFLEKLTQGWPKIDQECQQTS